MDVRVVIAACHERRCFEFAAAVRDPGDVLAPGTVRCLFRLLRKDGEVLIHQYCQYKARNGGRPNVVKICIKILRRRERYEGATKRL